MIVVAQRTRASPDVRRCAACAAPLAFYPDFEKRIKQQMSRMGQCSATSPERGARPGQGGAAALGQALALREGLPSG
jgi:hypothetical protein